MKKLLQHLDNNILKWCVILTALFVVLYPKLPSIHIDYTWVYIRLEDFSIAFISILWLIQVVRRKVRLALPLGIPILIYWLVGLASLLYAIHFFGPVFPSYFPKIGGLEFLRRIEYMILFFVGFSTIQSLKDLKEYIIALCVGLTAVVLYGLGQHFYLYIWNINPKFFEHFPFCFPSFQTGNEEFAKGIPLCLPADARVTSTFAGHYDLAGYLVLLLPMLLGIMLFVKKKFLKVLLGILFIVSLAILNFTSSRIAYPSYLIAVASTLIFLNKKKLILPVFLISFLFLFLFSQSTINRFLQTFRITTVVLNNQEQVVGIAPIALPAELQKKIAKGSAIQENIPSQALPAGSSFITLAQPQVATSVAVVKKALTAKEAAQLKLANGGLELSKVSGNFHLQKALVYDISITTRIQAEWPNAISAFLRNPLLGTGYSSITLATDNDYLRLLGESGVLGFLSFLFIFVVLGIYIKELVGDLKGTIAAGYVYGITGGVLGLFFYAFLFDIFEASKVAEPLWILIGVAAGVLSLSKKKVLFFKRIGQFFTSHTLYILYLLLAPIVAFGGIMQTFFVGDDFVWLKWAATSTTADIKNYFLAANGFFYRPLDKTIMLLLYSLFSFSPAGYHSVILMLHGIMAVGVYALANQIFHKKSWAFFAALFFVFLPVHGENIFWISSLSIDLGSVFVIFALTSYIHASKKTFGIWYIVSLILSVFALLSYELAIVMPLLVILTDLILKNKNKLKGILFDSLPFIVLDIVYLITRVKVHALSSGGDYSYSIPHLLPNIFGNILGYFGLFIGGERFLPLYTILRTSMKVYTLPIGIFLAIVIIIFGMFAYQKKLYAKILFKENIWLFGILFFVIALLPYLGLGNIAERYGYLASVGFVIVIIYLLQLFVKKITAKSIVKKILLIGSIAIVVGIWCLSNYGISLTQWQTVGKITYNSLGYFKIEQDNPLPTDTFYIVNLPIRRANAWIFPTGFAEGLWFLYRDDEPRIVLVNNVVDAKKLQQKTSGLIFTFDKNYNLHQVQ